MPTFQEVLNNRFKEIKAERKAVKEGRDPRSTIPTGIRELDKRAFHKRKILTIYGAPTGEGKSIWKLHLMREAAKRGYKVLVLDFEDPEEKTADREFSNATGINSALMGAAGLDDKQVQQIALALAESSEWADNIQMELGVRTADEALDIVNDGEYDLVLVDYLSALPHGKNGRERAISDFCWGLTKYAQDNNAAVVAFAQVSSEVSERGHRIAEMHKKSAAYRNDPESVKPHINGFRAFDNNDLAWCKDAGKTAKELGFMFRPGKWYKMLDSKTSEKDNVMEFDFPKRNFGAEGRITVGFDAKTARLFDLSDKKAA